MQEIVTMEENFSIEFDGIAFERHEIPASALAQSLLALDGIARRAAEASYGKDAEIDIKVKGSFQPGSFLMNMIITHGAELTMGASAVTIIQGIISLGKWAFGKKVREIQIEENDCVRVENEHGNNAIFNKCVVNVYNNARIQNQLSRLTQTLDMEGADSIKIYSSNLPPEIVTKEDRWFFRQEDGLVLTDNENECILEIVGSMLNGSSKGWRFSEGENGIEFTANVEDESFLSAVRERKYVFVNGTIIRAVVRTVQRKNVRTRTERTIVEVKEVFSPEDILS